MKKSRHNRKFWRSPTHSMLRLMPSGSVTWPVPGIVDLAKAQRNVNTLLATVEHLVSFAMRLQPRIFSCNLVGCFQRCVCNQPISPILLFDI